MTFIVDGVVELDAAHSHAVVRRVHATSVGGKHDVERTVRSVGKAALSELFLEATATEDVFALYFAFIL